MGDSPSVRIGGLMRCCIQTIYDSDLPDDPDPGDQINCRHCWNVMVWKNGAWQWDREASG